MFKFVKFEKVVTEFTVLEFRGSVEGVEVNSFDKNVVSLSGDVTKIDELIAKQPIEIQCVEITQDEFKALVTDSAQLKRIREVVAEKVAEKYTFADEIAISKRAVDDIKRVEYQQYIDECLVLGYGLKAEIGY